MEVTHIADDLEELASEFLERLFLIFGLGRDNSVKVVTEILSPET